MREVVQAIPMLCNILQVCLIWNVRSTLIKLNVAITVVQHAADEHKRGLICV